MTTRAYYAANRHTIRERENARRVAKRALNKVFPPIIPDIISKFCRACSTEKPRSQFATSRSSGDGLFNWCRECGNARSRANYVANREYRCEKSLKYRTDNPEILQAYRRLDKTKEKTRKWFSDHPELRRSYEAARRARKAMSGGRYTPDDIADLLLIQKHKCAHMWCRKSLKGSYHVDHRNPIVLGGGSDRRNIQLLCPPCNLQKNRKHPVDFALQNGMLV